MIIFDSMTFDGVIIDHVINMTRPSNIDSVKKENGHFHRLNLNKHDLLCSDRDNYETDYR